MRYIYLVIGVISLIIGVIGTVVVILPTTPFLLLSAFCFSRSSEKLDNWFKGTDMYKKYISPYVEKKEMTKSSKIKLLSFITVFLAIGFYFSPNIAKVIIFIVLIGHYYYFIFKVKTLGENN